MRVLRFLTLVLVLALGVGACADESSDAADDADEEVSTDGTDSDGADTDAGPVEATTEPTTEPTTDDTTPETSDDPGTSAGSSGLSDEELALVDLLMDEMRSDAGELDPTTAEEEEVYVRCAAEGIVRELGVDRLEELGVSAEAIEAGESTWGNDDFTLEEAGGTLEEARVMADVTYGCGFLDLMSAAFGEMSPDASECLTAAIDSDEFRDAFAQSIFSGDDTTLDDLMDQAMGTCFTPGDLLAPGITAMAPDTNPTD